MAKEKVYVVFGDKERAKLEAEGYKIINVEHTPIVRGHGGDIIVTVEKNS